MIGVIWAAADRQRLITPIKIGRFPGADEWVSGARTAVTVRAEVVTYFALEQEGQMHRVNR
jgi:hypothetical protein